MKQTETKAALVVMEGGTRWPSYASEIRGRASSAIVEAQPPSESLHEFSARVIGRLRRLSTRRVTVPVAILAVSDRTDFEATTARYHIARAVLAVMAPSGNGELILLADEHASEDVRHELIAFAGALCDGLQGSSLSVRVRFSTQSGVRPLVAASPPAWSEQPAPVSQSFG